MFNRTLSSFLPNVYKDVVEMDDVMRSEENIMDIARREMSSAFANTFVLTANESGVIMFEKMLNIIANPLTEDLEFRRQRILNRLSMSPPFTYRFLKQKLDEIIGVGAWTAYVNFDTYTLFVESSAVDQNWYYEMEFTINRIKPCNMVFTNVPLTAPGIQVNEQISYEALKWMYKLGAWKLGEHPFAIVEREGVIKMADVGSIQKTLLNDTAKFVNDDISYVLLNDSIKITEFKSKQVTESTIFIEYDVYPHMTSLVTSIKLMREDGVVLTQASVYVPITQTVVSKHIITVKEGT